MGIRGVWSTFRKGFNIVDPTTVEPLRIGIDMFSLVYTHRAHLDDLLSLLKTWSLKHQITCIWDGTAPKEKMAIIGERRSVRESAIETKSDLETYLADFGDQLDAADIKHLKTAITSLSWQGWHLTAALKKQIQDTLGPQITHVFAAGEADDMLLDMIFVEKTIDLILTLDSDLFAMGAERIWRLLRMRGEWLVEDIRVEAVCRAWGISLGQLQDASFLAGWDRCHLTGGSYMPFEMALNRIKHYKTLQAVLDKFPPVTPPTKELTDRLMTMKRDSKVWWQEILRTRV